MKSLFLGGPVDGQRLETDGQERFNVMDAPDPEAMDDTSREAPGKGEGQVDSYERVPLHIGLRGVVALYKHESLELEDCLPRLIEGYVSPSKKDTSLKRIEELEQKVSRLAEENLMLKVKAASDMAMA